ncbi:uncharacterized protein LOC123713492 isoform X1 [Pieris brassicae]|uniref:uncharacterized protein LOC123713492 isoform X1 n=2 Tax=Pieris brassicae TaxID=7116 RepID=UPI001E65F348|nr:uncharacterized protein LOC123713492 isoform X1 [Pieris brassicae]
MSKKRGFSLLFLWLNCVTCEGQYECGEHGRFEYCIDEIPGCVIGCHCHPGYYFDTDTKICEPSVKLTQNYRRRYNIEPTQTDIEYVTMGVTELTPVTRMDPINNQVDEITKTADDLGDWLYNQFFKTIENEVINNTKEAVPTRRNGGTPIKNMDLRRSSTKRNKKLKQKRRKSSLRRKLLRITADDSAFDTSEERHSDSSDSSSSEESDSSFEIEHKEDKHKDDKEHGHKKIVIINKKPRPPLPSFIFLPNMDTPFYPPIGLPPPPIMPMYPLVPVPPMPVFPCPEQDGSSATSPTRAPTITTAKESTIEKATTHISDHGTTEVKLGTSEIPIKDTTAEPATEAAAKTPQDPAKPERAGYYRQRKKPKPSFQSRPFMGVNNRKPMQPYRQKMKSRQQVNNADMLRAPYGPQNANDDEIVETPFAEENMYDETLNNEIQSNPQRYAAKADNVDFKYISELIHHIDLNKSRDLPPIEYNSKEEELEFYKPRKAHKMRKPGLNPPIGTRRLNSDDSYYTNLGRQIASIIRNVDSQNQVDIEIEPSGQNNDKSLFINDNSHRSFWERSVRSPLKYLKSNKNKYDYLKKSNEVLFNIENKVSIVASTAPTLSLQEIENIVNIMEKAQSKMVQKRRDLNKYKPSNDNLNFKLWPSENQLQNHDNAMMKPLHAPNLQNNVAVGNDKMPELKALSMHNIQRVTALLTSKRDNRTFNQNIGRSPAKDFTINPQINLPPPLIAPNSYNLQKSIQPLNYYHNNVYRGINKYFQDRNLTPEDDGSHLPKKSLGQLINKPSYFHQEINHFDYFE